MRLCSLGLLSTMGLIRFLDGTFIMSVSSYGRRLSHVLVGSSAKNPGDRWPCIGTRVGFFFLTVFIIFLSSQIIQSSSLLRGSEVTQGHSECVVRTALFLIGSVLGGIDRVPFCTQEWYLATESYLGGCHPG